MKERILKLVEDGLTYKQIKKELGCSLSTISYHCKNNSIESKHTQKKLSDDEIIKIKDLYEETKSCIKVAKILGFSKSTVLKYIDVFDKEKLSDDEVKKRKSKQVIYWRKKAKLNLVEYKGGKCEKCGYNKCVDALEFHHLDPNEKDFSVGGKSWSLERLKKEVDKCILICANCHRELHSNTLL